MIILYGKAMKAFIKVGAHDLCLTLKQELDSMKALNQEGNFKRSLGNTVSENKLISLPGQWSVNRR